jgi:hypothetical protein
MSHAGDMGVGIHVCNVSKQCHTWGHRPCGPGCAVLCMCMHVTHGRWAWVCVHHMATWSWNLASGMYVSVEEHGWASWAKVTAWAWMGVVGKGDSMHTVTRAVRVGSHQRRQMAAGRFAYLIDMLCRQGHRRGRGKDMTWCGSVAWCGGCGVVWWVKCGVAGVVWCGRCGVAWWV